MPDSPAPTTAGRVHVSYRRSNGAWSAPVCRSSTAAAEHYAATVNGHLKREAKWEYRPCDCPKVPS